MAQERKKRRIVLASILKPVDDTRMFGKMGVSLALSGDYEVFIIGYPARNHSTAGNVQFLPLKPFHRLSMSRLLARWRVFRLARKLAPDILVITTHELLFQAILLKLIARSKIVYDVRENYFRNILQSGNFRGLIRYPLSLLVRAKEKMLAPLVDHFFLAEKAYDNEFGFHRRAWTVLENKVSTSTVTTTRTKDSGKIRLLFSGTLAESTGVFEAIRLAEGLHRADPSVELTIVGHAALRTVRDRIHREIKDLPYIRLIGGSELVPHTEIMKLVAASDAGIIAYPPSDHTVHSRPTKLFEYLHARLPIILEKRWPWIAEFESCHPFLFADFSQPDYQGLLNQLKINHFYTEAPAGIDWQSEAPKLLAALGNL